MKRIMGVYESCRMAIRVTYFAFALIAFGYLIQNENVNLFYTFKSSAILFIAELFLNIGELIVMNLPLIFMLNIVCKKANSSSPLVMALVGYFTYQVTTMLFSSQNLGAYAYANGLGINSVFNIVGGSRLPLETGLIGSLLVAYATRMAFVYSRNRSNSSLLGFFNKDTAGIILNVLFCFGAGFVVAYAYPYIYKYIQNLISYIGEDLMDPFRIALYGMLDRALSILGLADVVRYPFWFTNLGGSYVNSLTGQAIYGDVNIFTALKDTVTGYIGAGRFITPYYVINMFIIPGVYVGMLINMSDRYERNHFIIVFSFAILLSVIAGNPLPAEFLMLFTSPMLLVAYLFGVACLFGSLSYFGIYLGFSTTVSNTAIAMPGTFPDFIIYLRNVKMADTLGKIAIVGVIGFVASVIMMLLYYRVFAYNLIETGKSEGLIADIIGAIGGKDNIDYVGSGLFRLNIYLNDLELVSVEKLQKIGARRITETRTGISIEFGTSSYMIGQKIKGKIK